MAEKITVPTLGESVTEATVSKWLKSQGEEVTADEPLVELETDKVNIEVPSPTSGVLGTITVKEGETVNVGSLLGTINSSATTDNYIKEVNFYFFYCIFFFRRRIIIYLFNIIICCC